MILSEMTPTHIFIKPNSINNQISDAKSLEKVNEKTTKIMNKHVNDLYNDARKWHG